LINSKFKRDLVNYKDNKKGMVEPLFLNLELAES
jgi:hypothetical protein